MADFIPVEQTDTFDQWRIKTNQLGADFASIEDSLEGAISNIDLSSKADTNHTHVITNVTNLQTELDTLGEAISANTTNIDNCVTFTGGTSGQPESISGKKAFLTEVDFYDGIRVVGGAGYPNSGIEINGTEPNNRLLVESGKMRLRNNDYTWPANYTGGRYLRTDSQGNLTWEEVAGGSGSVNLSTLVFNDIVPVGTIMPWAGTSLPADGKWKFCNGENVSKNTYSELFGIIANKYGTASTNNFRLPNLTGKVPLGAGSSTYIVGNTGGKINQSFSGSGNVTGGVSISGSTAGHKLTGAETGVKAHSHTMNTNPVQVNTSRNQSQGAGTKLLTGQNQTGRGAFGSSYSDDPDVLVSTNSSSSQNATATHSHGAGTLSGSLSGASASLTGSVNVMQPYLITQYIIKVLPDDVQQVSIHAGNGINVQNAQGNDSDKLDLFSTALNVAVNLQHFKFSASGLLELKVFPTEGPRGQDGQPGTSVTASVSNGILTITSA